MIHLAGMLLVTAAGMAAANVEEWPKVKEKAEEYVRQVLREFKSSSAQTKPTSLSATRRGSAPKKTSAPTGGTRSSQALVKGSTNVPQQAESQRVPYRFALSTGTMAFATIAQLSGNMLLIPMSLFLTGYLAAPIFKEALTAIVKDKQVRVDILDAVVISLCLLFSEFGVAAFMVWVLDFVDLLLDKTTRKSQTYLAEIFGEQTRFAWMLVDGVEVQVAVSTLQLDDIIVVTTGEQIPVDGLVIEGGAMIDQHSLTGEAAPVEKHEGETVFAMTVLVSGKIKIRVQKTGEDTLASKIVQIINDASVHKVKLQSIGEQLADQMVIPTLSLGVLGYATTGVNATLAIINADFGTGIRVAAPIALLASLGMAAKQGILIKDSKVFELLPETKIGLFDKTGTLTYDVPAVSEIVPADSSYKEEQILLYTAAAEQKFSHPIAKALLNKAAQEQMILPVYDESLYYVGMGIEVTLHGDHVKVGSSRYFEREQIPIPDRIRHALHQTRSRGHTAILTAINNRVAGMIELQATVRTEAKQMIAELRRRGMKEIVLISGDHDAPTRELASTLGVDRYFASVLPHEKAEYVQRLQRGGRKVMMVGDGINDSAALSCADISVSLKGASTIATDVADVVFMDGSLRKFGSLYEVSDALHLNVTRSFYMIALPNTVCIVGALMGFFGLSASLVLNNGFNVLAAANGMHLYAEAEKDHPVLKQWRDWMETVKSRLPNGKPQ